MGNTNTGVPHHKALPGHAHQTARPVFHWKERPLGIGFSWHSSIKVSMHTLIPGQMAKNHDIENTVKFSSFLRCK